MKQYYSVEFLDKNTKKVLKRFTYPMDKIKSKFFWEKIKLEEKNRLTNSRLLDSEDVIMFDTSDKVS